MRSTLDNFLVLMLVAINAISIFGFATFTLHPALLTRWPWTMDVFAVSYPLFARLQIIVAFLALVAALRRVAGWRWVNTFGVLFVLSAASELLGTTYGIPFGKYQYTDFLGPKIADRVPWLIPPSWFFMAVPSFRLARRALGDKAGSIARISLGALFLLVWDLTLDPAMSYLAPFWLWSHHGMYYGMPLLNLFGWFVTGLMLMAVLNRPAAQSWLAALPDNFVTALYGANLALPLGMCIAAGLWWPVAITTLFAALLGLRLHREQRRDPALASAHG